MRRRLLTVRAAISSALPSDIPRSTLLSLMCSYWRSSLFDQLVCGMSQLCARAVAEPMPTMIRAGDIGRNIETGHPVPVADDHPKPCSEVALEVRPRSPLLCDFGPRSHSVQCATAGSTIGDDQYVNSAI